MITTLGDVGEAGDPQSDVRAVDEGALPKGGERGSSLYNTHLEADVGGHQEVRARPTGIEVRESEHRGEDRVDQAPRPGGSLLVVNVFQ